MTVERTYEISVAVKEVQPRNWAAIATHKSGTASGQGSTFDVAAYKAVQNLVKALGSIEPDFEAAAAAVEEDKSNEGKKYFINVGRRGGQMCTFIRVLATLEDGDVYEVRYEDGSTGSERAKFISAVLDKK
jgi:hypothetical protein